MSNIANAKSQFARIIAHGQSTFSTRNKKMDARKPPNKKKPGDGSDWENALSSEAKSECIICKKDFVLWHQGPEVKMDIGEKFVHTSCVVS